MFPKNVILSVLGCFKTSKNTFLELFFCVERLSSFVSSYFLLWGSCGSVFAKKPEILFFLTAAKSSFSVVSRENSHERIFAQSASSVKVATYCFANSLLVIKRPFSSEIHGFFKFFEKTENHRPPFFCFGRYPYYT